MVSSITVALLPAGTGVLPEFPAGRVPCYPPGRAHLRQPAVLLHLMALSSGTGAALPSRSALVLNWTAGSRCSKDAGQSGLAAWAAAVLTLDLKIAEQGGQVENH